MHTKFTVELLNLLDLPGKAVDDQILSYGSDRVIHKFVFSYGESYYRAYYTKFFTDIDKVVWNTIDGFVLAAKVKQIKKDIWVWVDC